MLTPGILARFPRERKKEGKSPLFKTTVISAQRFANPHKDWGFEFLGFRPLWTPRGTVLQGLQTPGEGPVYEGVVPGFFANLFPTLSFLNCCPRPGEKGLGDPGPGQHPGPPRR